MILRYVPQIGRSRPEEQSPIAGDFRVSIGIDFYAKIGYPFILKSG
jgi:hypothetical protein